jgi:DNA repair exonuclease SbcCD ATPase subunit
MPTKKRTRKAKSTRRTQSNKSSLIILNKYSKLIVFVFIAFGFGSLLSYSLLTPQLSELRSHEEVLNSEITFLNSRVENLEQTERNLNDAQANIAVLNQNLMKFEQENIQYNSQINQLNSQLSGLQDNLESQKLELDTILREKDLSDLELNKINTQLDSVKSVIIRFNNDKLLLVELRKEVPQTRNEAHEHWKNVKTIAIQTDSSLGPAIDKVIIKVDPYYDWVAKLDNVTSDQEYIEWIIEGQMSGAYTYGDEIVEFRNDALLAVIIRMDAALSLIA